MIGTQLIICGSIALDRIMNYGGTFRDVIHPDKLHVLSVSVLLDNIEQTRGGSGATIAYYAALLGNKPLLYDSAGEDAVTYLEKLSSLGVDTGSVHISKLPTASFNVMTDLEDNQIGGFYPGAMSDAADLSLEPWAKQDVLVCISAHDPAAMNSQIEECRRFGIRFVYDPGQQVSNVSGDDLTAGIEAAEILMVNDYEFEALCKKTGRSAADIKAKVPIVVTTYGKEGSVIEGARVDTAIKIDVARPNDVVDPTGAGDAYRAGFLHGYLRKWELRQCGQLGSVVASFAVEKHGTQQTVSQTAILNRYSQTYNQEITL
jgi:adenosine kinase